jgi:peptide/nickel transport system substrate-binding protein
MGERISRQITIPLGGEYMHKKLFSVLSVLLVVVFLLSACAKPAPTAAPTEAPTAAPTVNPFPDQPFGENLPTAPTITTPLVIAIDTLSQKFSPFFADTGYDVEIAGQTQISLLTTDRVGGIIYNAIEGETVPYNGKDYLYKGPADTKVAYDKATDTTKYTARLRVGMKFSDGEPVTADDLIFSYYTFLDPSYVGSTSLSSFDIVGLKDYQTQTTSEVYDKYAKLVDAIYTAGVDHVWAATDSWTKEQQDDFWARIKESGMAEVQKIIDYVISNYLDYAGDIGKTGDEVTANDGLKVALAMAEWGYGTWDKTTGVLTAPSGATWDLVEKFPTAEEYYADILANYGSDLKAAFPLESADGTDVFATVKSAFVGFWGPKDEAMGGKGVPNIAGIVKVDDYTVEVTVKGFSAPAVYSILGINVTPLHYYGDVAKYDYANNKFGFDFGDLSKQESLTATPMGAGPYKFVKYENRVVYFDANPYYYRGCPKIKEIQYKETASAEVASGVQTGTVDAGELSGSRSRFEEVASYNSNGEITGNVITTSKVDNLGYGYIGINADTVNVGGDGGSVASKNLRKGLATILAAYRDVAINSYYGEAASVINYPISNTSWAAPQPTDEDYKVAFSTDVTGAPIYTADMTPEQKYAAAEKAALAYFEAAGYTVANGKVTAAPEGAKMTYEVIVPGGGTGDHPAFAVLTGAQSSLKNIGMELKINDPADTNILWDALDAGTNELWTAAWGATIDPDMYQIYNSGNVPGEGGTDSNNYRIRDTQLDKLIDDARKSDDQSYRKAIYKQALDIIIDWAVEVPNYQRQNCIVFSTERINIATLTPDITTFWGWLNDIELVELK